MGFNEQELLRDANFDESYMKSPRPDISIQQLEHDKSDNITTGAPTMDVDLPQLDDGFGGNFMGELFVPFEYRTFVVVGVQAFISYGLRHREF